MKTFLILGILLASMGAAPLPIVQGQCAPTAETFGITEVAGRYLKHSFVLIGTTTQTERIELWQETNNLPGLQTTSAQACGALPDTKLAGVTEGAATDSFAIYACMSGFISYCPLA